MVLDVFSEKSITRSCIVGLCCACSYYKIQLDLFSERSVTRSYIVTGNAVVFMIYQFILQRSYIVGIWCVYSFHKLKLDLPPPTVCGILRSGPSTDQGSFREESFSNTGDFNSGGPAAGKKKTDFEDDIGGFEVRLSPSSATQT